MAMSFPRFPLEEDNFNLMETIPKEYLPFVLQSFEKDKSPMPHEWPMEFFLRFCDLFEVNLLRMIEDSRFSCKILEAFNSTSIALIPKSDNTLSFENYKLVSLCNFIYKIISKMQEG